MLFKRIKIRTYEAGLVFFDGEFRGLLAPGVHWRINLLGKLKVEIVSLRAPWLTHEKLDLIVASGALNDRAVVVDLKDDQRALVWIDERFSHVLPPGLYAYWTSNRKVRVEIVHTRTARFEHAHLRPIVQAQAVGKTVTAVTVEPGHAGVVFVDGRHSETLPSGEYAYWKNAGAVKIVDVDLRENMLDVVGQEIVTADKVTLRVNAVVVFRVADPLRTVTQATDARQALYREAQFALRAAIGLRDLDAFLAEKDAVAKGMSDAVRLRAVDLGLDVLSVGIRDVILPGDMKELMNKVTEAKKAAEANLIARREETAAMRSQANTAKLLADSPALMRLRELETLEKIAAGGHLRVVMTDKGLVERVANLL